MDCLTLFRGALQADFGVLDFIPAADGQLHRFHVPGDRVGSRNGWYILHLNGIPTGIYGSWKVSGYHRWSSREPVDYSETQQIQQRIEQARCQREFVQQQRQQATAEYAQRSWGKARSADTNHPYLATKRAQTHNLRQVGERLLVPLYQNGKLVNLQRIDRGGSKRFLSGGLIKGACAHLGVIAPNEALYLCEGWATGATIHEHTGAAVACAMNAGNLMEVGLRLQRQHPDAVLIVAGDDDRLTEGNPGRTAANNVANALGCGLVFPPWSGTEPLELSDFNDLAQWRSAQ